MQKHIAYLVLLLATWIACCVIWGAELHKGSQSGVSFSFHYNFFSGGGTSTDYDQCSSSSDFCKSCASGGKGAVAMSVFAWLGLTFNIILRMAFLAGKAPQIPKLGEDMQLYNKVERVTNYVVTALWLLVIIIWGATCFQKTQGLSGISSVAPTGFVYVILCLFVMIGACVLLNLIHNEIGTGNGAGGNSGGATAARSGAPSSSQPADKQMQPASQPRGPPPRPPANAEASVDTAPHQDTSV